MSSEMTSINLSSNAVKRIQGLLPSHKSNYFRVYVTGGGCSGFQYGFSFDNTIDEDDTCIQKEGANLVIDSLSLQYLQGSTVDYVEDLTGSKFIISNPNATTTCGCGESFSI